MKVKICGLTNLEDALAASDAGADLLGFNFYPASPRYIAPPDCARLVNALRSRGCPALLVGVFVNMPAGEVAAILGQCSLDLAQLSGDESPQALASLGESGFKALRPTSLPEMEEMTRRFPARAHPPAWLVDAYRPDAYGGTGQVARWDLARRLARQAPVLLAGGLNPSNVVEAIRQVRPWGVDVASGVESTPGHKDNLKISAFIRAVRSFSEQEEIQ